MEKVTENTFDKAPVVKPVWPDRHVIVSNPNVPVVVDNPKYPFADLSVGQGVFLPVEPNSTLDKLNDDVHKSILLSRRAGIVELNQFGDEVHEQVIIKTRKRNPDGTLALDHGKYIYGADPVTRPKLLCGGEDNPSFMIRSVLKDEVIDNSDGKAPFDGALVIRVS